MKKIELFILRNCPYCIEAIGWQDELMRENPGYREIEIEMIDESEQAERANLRDYYYVPTYYLDGEKLHEGAASREKVKAVLDAALAS